MAWNLGLLGASLPAELGSYDLLETVSLSSSAASVTFSNLNTYAGTYQHLQLRMAVRGNRPLLAQDVIRINLNGDATLSNYNYHELIGNGSSVTSGYVANENYLITTDGSNSATNAFGAAVVDFLDPYETTKFKTVRALSGHSSPDVGGQTGKRINLSSLLWRNTNALTSITFSTLDSTLVAGSRFSLYGIKGA